MEMHVADSNQITDFTLDRGRTVGVVRGAISAAVTATMEFCQGADTHALAQIDVTSNGSCGKLSGAGSRGPWSIYTGPYIVPIRVIRTLLFKGARLDEIDPIRDFELAGAL